MVPSGSTKDHISADRLSLRRMARGGSIVRTGPPSGGDHSLARLNMDCFETKSAGMSARTALLPVKKLSNPAMPLETTELRPLATDELLDGRVPTSGILNMGRGEWSILA